MKSVNQGTFFVLNLCQDRKCVRYVFSARTVTDSVTAITFLGLQAVDHHVAARVDNTQNEAALTRLLKCSRKGASPDQFI